MNETTRLLKSHRSYRQFDQSYELSDKELQEILDSARQAPSWMNGQFYSILVIREKKVREKLVSLNPGNPHILESSVFLLFLADLKRSQQITQQKQTEFRNQEVLDSLLIAITDASLALQNAIVASESLNLGVVPVGSVRNNLDEYKELFDLPDYVFPVAGLSIGKPIVEMKIKPRLPEETVIHYDSYKTLSYKKIDEYDDTMEKFGEARETKIWSTKFSDYFNHTPSKKIENFLKKQHLIK